uniref:Uncharacterized protein n=1 Tax=Macrostomum lignano TaxID=282301 RepID=A0A1I8FMQ2_9PLAT
MRQRLRHLQTLRRWTALSPTLGELRLFSQRRDSRVARRNPSRATPRLSGST